VQPEAKEKQNMVAWHYVTLLLLLLNFIRTQKYNINEVQEKKIQRVSKEKAIETTTRSQVIVDPYTKNRSW
jgi:hypothetical protein